MKLRKITRFAAIIAVIAPVLFGLAQAAHATLIHGTFAGVITGGSDHLNTLGGGLDLTGQAITGHVYLDTALAPAGKPAGTHTTIYESLGGTPWLWGSFTINGVTRNVGPGSETYTSVSSFSEPPDFLNFFTNTDVIVTSPSQRLFMRSSLDLTLFDLDDVLVPGKDLPSAGFTWSPDTLFDFGSGSVQAFDQIEFLPNGPIQTVVAVLAEFSVTTAQFEVIATPGTLPLLATGLAALALLGRGRQRAARAASRRNALA